jgi:hypothetical protein
MELRGWWWVLDDLMGFPPSLAATVKERYYSAGLCLLAFHGDNQ